MRTADIDRLVASIAPDTDPGPGLTPGARELLAMITAEDVTAPSRRRPPRVARLPLFRLQPRHHRLLVPLVLAVVLLSWTLPGGLGLGPRPADALSIKRSGMFFTIVVRNVYADGATYRRELSARGMRISMVVVPGGPGAVGQIVVTRDGPVPANRYAPASWSEPDGHDIAPLAASAYCRHDTACPIGLMVRAGHWGDETVWLSRRALPGEAYLFPGTAGAPPR
jgi:hypothetical protein